MPQPHWYKSLKTRITSIYFHFLRVVQTWVTSVRTRSEWQGLSIRLQHPPTQLRPYSEVVHMNKVGAGQLRDSQTEPWIFLQPLTLTAVKSRRPLHESQSSTVRELWFRHAWRPWREKQWMKSRVCDLEMKPTKCIWECKNITSHILKNWIKLVKLKELRRHKTVVNVNVKISLCLIKDTVLDVYGRKEVQLHSLLTTTLDGAEWSASRIEEKTPHLRRKSSTFLQIHFSPKTSTLCSAELLTALINKHHKSN